MSQYVRVNQKVLEMEYAVRGPIPQRAAEMACAGRQTIPCNIGNPQALGQRPISFYRQVLSLLENPDALLIGRDWVEGGAQVSEDILDMARDMVEASRTGSGAYTDSAGFGFIRESVARFIDRRDRVGESGGPPSDPERVILTDGASGGAVTPAMFFLYFFEKIARK